VLDAMAPLLGGAGLRRPLRLKRILKAVPAGHPPTACNPATPPAVSA
jgi:hypothetical protein